MRQRVSSGFYDTQFRRVGSYYSWSIHLSRNNCLRRCLLILKIRHIRNKAPRIRFKGVKVETIGAPRVHWLRDTSLGQDAHQVHTRMIHVILSLSCRTDRSPVRPNARIQAGLNSSIDGSIFDRHDCVFAWNLGCHSSCHCNLSPEVYRPQRDEKQGSPRDPSQAGYKQQRKE